MADDPARTDSFADLELPDMHWRKMMRHFGPGLILMMTGIGTSHLVTAPAAGGRFEYALLWCIPVAYVFKYYGFEMAFRFTNATGKSMMEAYATAPKKWPVWYVLITTLIQCAVGQASRLIAAAAVMYYFASEQIGLDLTFNVTAENPEGLDLNLPVYSLILAAASVTIILKGSYKWVERVTKIAAGMLVASSIAAFFVDLPPITAMGNFFMVQVPEASWAVIAAFLGLLPTGIDVSLQASEWGKAKKVGMGRIRPQLEADGIAPKFDPFEPRKEDLSVDVSALSPHAVEYARRWFRIGIWDFRLGHVISFILACVFLLLAAIWMYPSEVEGTGVMGDIADIFIVSVGDWMMWVFVLGAFAATFSTAFNYFDGWPRLVGACCRNLFQSTASLQGIARDDLTHEKRTTWYSEYNIYRMTMLYSLVTAVLFVGLIPKPVFLVLLGSALALFVAPVVFFLNVYYCRTIIPKQDKVFHPSKFAMGFSWFSLAVFTVLTAIVFQVRVIDKIVAFFTEV